MAHYYLCAMKILMVCLGNICRSPLAEGILRAKAKKAKLNWTVESAGTDATLHIGQAPHKYSQQVADFNNIDISKHEATQFVKEDAEHYDFIYVMDDDNYNEVKRISKNLWDKNKVDFLMNEIYPTKNMEIPDPWFGELDGYFEVYNMMNEACKKIIEKALSLTQKQF